MKKLFYTIVASIALIINSSAYVSIGSIEYDWEQAICMVQVDSDEPYTIYRSLDGITWDAVTRTIKPSSGPELVFHYFNLESDGNLGYVDYQYKVEAKRRGKPSIALAK